MDNASPKESSPDFSEIVASVGVLFASICFGLVPCFSRSLIDEGLAPHAVAFCRYVIAAVILFPALVGQIKALA